MQRREISFSSEIPFSAVIGKSPDDHSLKPRTAWQSTGLIESGEAGAGCAVKCIYCNQKGMDIDANGERKPPYLSGMVDGGLSINTRIYSDDKLSQTLSPEDLISAIESWPLYTPQSPVILENFNDPGNNWKGVAEVAKMLVGHFEHEAPIAFITKMGIKDADVAALVEAQLLGAKLVGIVTYSNMPKKIEPSSSQVRLGTMRRLKEAGIPVIVSMRPITKGINDSQENIDLVLNQVAPYADVVIVGGLFVFEQFTIDAFRDAGYPLDESYSDQIYSPQKVMKEGYKKIVRIRAQQIQPDLLVHYHTSCAIVTAANKRYDDTRSDRFTHWVSPTGLQFDHDCAHCPTDQMELCKQDAAQPIETVIDNARSVLDRLGYPDLKLVPSYDVSHTLLLDGAVLTFEEIAAIKEGCHWYVDNLPNAAGMHLRMTEALSEDMQLDPKKVVAGMFLVGQEWHIVIRDAELNADGNIELIEKWIRSRSRHRARVLRLTDIKNGDSDAMISALTEKSHGLQSAAEITRSILSLRSGRKYVELP